MHACALPPRVPRGKVVFAAGAHPIGTKRGNSMTSQARAGAVDSASPAATEGVGAPTEAGDAGAQAHGGSGADGDILNERVEKRIMDIEAGRVKMRRHTLDEHMRHLDEMLGG